MAAKGPVATEARKKFGKALREARLAAGMTQAQLAERAEEKLAIPDISLIENGKRNPSLDMMHRLAKAVGMEIDLVWRPAASPPRKRRTPKI